MDLPRLLAPYLPSNWYPARELNCSHSNCQTCKGLALLFIVTTSLCQDWVIYAPAAFLGCGSRISGSFSEILPLVIFYPLKPWYSNALPSKADRTDTWMIHRRHGAMQFEKLLWIIKAPPKRVGLYLINTTLPQELGSDACISSRILWVSK